MSQYRGYPIIGDKTTKAMTYIPAATKIKTTSVIPAITAMRPRRRVRDEPVVSRPCIGLQYPEAAMAKRLEPGASVARLLPGDHMTDGAPDSDHQQRGNRAVEFRVAARLENLAMLRTLVGAVGTFEDLDFDAVADLRLAVDEVCTRLMRSATPDATLLVVVDPRDDGLVVEASATCKTYDVVTPGSFSWHVLTSLADDVKTFNDGSGPDAGGGLFGITLTARRAGSAR